MASKDLFALLNKLAGSESDRKTVVSSAKDKMFSVVLFEMSLMYIRKRSGPRMEPWGTPHLTGKVGDMRVDTDKLAPISQILFNPCVRHSTYSKGITCMW